MFDFAVTEAERTLGMGFYATPTPGIGGRLRVRAEDFVVQEASAPVAAAQAGGKYTLATIRATNWETNRLVREMARRLHISERTIYFAGTKDKRAITVQNIALAASEEAVRSLDISDVEVVSTRRVDRAPKIGELSGNGFKIRIREFAPDPDDAFARVELAIGHLLDAGGFPNFFGPQRFGSIRPVTHLVGREITRGRLAEALWTYVAHPSPLDPPSVAAMRARVWTERDPQVALDLLPTHLDFERGMLRYLVDHPGDAVGALDQLPRTLSRMLVGAYQSLLFNRMLTRRAQVAHPRDALVGDVLHPAREDGTPDPSENIPVREKNLARCIEATRAGQGFTTAALAGFDTAPAQGVQGEVEKAVLGEESLEPDQFRILEAPYLSSHGTRRAMWCPVDKIDAQPGRDEAGSFIELAFFLPKGCYATCLLREIMKTDLTRY